MGLRRSTGNRQADGLILDSESCLSRRGAITLGSGHIRLPRISSSLHSDFGPPGQDKESNQDYALAWCSPGGDPASGVEWAVALGDGLTSSRHSEVASALACWIGLRALLEADVRAGSRETAQRAFEAVAVAIRMLGRGLRRDPRISCPPDEFLSTWRYILRKGALLETTLTLAWVDRQAFRVAMVGDGAAFLRDAGTRDGAEARVDRTLTRCDLESHVVQALGPRETSPPVIDFWFERPLGRPFLCVLSTDGLARGLENDATAILEGVAALEATGAKNPAHDFIETMLRVSPSSFDDNLSLAVLRVDDRAATAH